MHSIFPGIGRIKFIDQVICGTLPLLSARFDTSCAALEPEPLHVFVYSLDISSHGIQNSGCVAIAEAAVAGKMRQISLGHNHIGERGVAAVKSAIDQVWCCYVA